MIRGSDGLDYEDLNARLLGELAKTSRNRILGPGSRHDEAFKADYRETYDHYERAGLPPRERHNRAFAQASFLENERFEHRRKNLLRTLADDFRARATRGAISLYAGEPPGGSPGGAGGTDSLQAALATLRPAAESPVRRGLGPQGHLPAPGEVQR